MTKKLYWNLHPPPIIRDHKEELVGNFTTKSAIHIPLDKPLPVTLIKKLIKARMDFLDAEARKSSQ
jgi:hypothetical protein